MVACIYQTDYPSVAIIYLFMVKLVYTDYFGIINFNFSDLFVAIYAIYPLVII